ncbi:hypothetical protein [Ancylobacter amanitiformis]|uniref:Transmembrane protein n=1 Tax=Ancylobacter amanitiformis TaxID=217069 RepID=A0ABU0LKU0_9HYPH|nr:hypothetical protein [Ancylobacter amanitiformis]MDQ0509320.1 hypothetical protein [Ancylobacter amanitiformis]
MSKLRHLVVLAAVAAGGLFMAVPEASAWRAAACGPRGCAAAGGPGYYPRGPGFYPNRGYAVPHGAYYGPRGAVVVTNPYRYWPPGGAVAAGAAVGFLAGAAAVTLAGPPPQPNYCWFYTNPQRTTGFWEACP